MIEVIEDAPRVDYEPHGNMLSVWYCHDPEVLVEGPAGTGKTRAILEKLDFLARKYAKCRILMVRKTRASMTQSVLKTFEDHVKTPDVSLHTTKQEYAYPNRSVIVVGGLDKQTKILSSEYDIVYVNEGNELTESDFETLTTRLRHGVIPYQQAIIDVNPDADTHWLNLRANTPQMTRIVTRHEDNPLYWDNLTDDYTDLGREYIIGKLDKLTGVRFLRYRKGVWARSEGLVYDAFDNAIHVIPVDKQARITRSFVNRYRVVDFGFTNPFVCQWWGEDGDGRLYLYREIYYSQRTVKTHSEQINKYSKGESYRFPAVCDHDAEDRATLRENGITTTGAIKAVTTGINKVKDRLAIQGDGKPRLYIFEDATIEIDHKLKDAGLPTSTLGEVGSYAWQESKYGKNEDEKPIKAYDHGMDAMRYLVAYVERYAPIKSQRDNPFFN